MKKRTKIAISIISGFLGVFFIAAMIYYFGASHKVFDSISTKALEIPGLETKFVPQGMEYDQPSNKVFVTGYMSNGEASRIYIINNETKKTEKYFTLTHEGETYLGHCGGIAIYDTNVWISGDGYLYRFELAQALSVENGKSIEVLDKLKTRNGADFLFDYDNKLIVGEFYKKGKYDTPENHHIQTSSGETNYALAFIYTINTYKSYGLESTTPEAGISLPNQVQGMCFNADGKIVLSTSYSLPNSLIYIHDNILNSSPSATTTINNNELQVYVLNKDNLVRTIEAPCMSEEIVLIDGKVCVLFENNCKKYKFFTRTRLKHIYALDI